MHYRESFSWNLHICTVRVIINKKNSTWWCTKKNKTFFFFSVELHSCTEKQAKELHTAGTTVDRDVNNSKGVEAEIEQFGCSH